MNDRIIIEGIRTRAVIGLHKEERSSGQELFVGVDLETDFSRVQESDRIDEGVDYCDIIHHVREFSEGFGGKTLERFAHRLALSLKEVFGATGVAVSVEKPRYAGSLDVGAIKVHVRR